MASKGGGGSGGGRLMKFLSFVSLLCLIAVIIYLALAQNPCDRIRRAVYLFNDVPAIVVLTVARPWSEGTNAFRATQSFFVGQRVVMANFMARQFHNQPNFAHMCLQRPSQPASR